MFDYHYVYLAVAVILIIGIGAIGVLLLRNGRRARGEDLFAAAPEGVKEGAGEPAAGTEASAEPAGFDAQRGGPWGTAPAPAALLADPLGTVILDLLGGTGKLAGGELKRLEVFRPERIDLAAQTLQLPPRLRGNEDAVMRLAQIQLYAATLQLRSKWSAEMVRQAGGGGDTPYSAGDFKLKIARDIMTLPTTDRSEVIGYLLGGLLGSDGAGPGLKRAVIDTLEHLHGAALVNVLLDCLDDPDPIIQEYALAAADRVLEG